MHEFLSVCARAHIFLFVVQETGQSTYILTEAQFVLQVKALPFKGTGKHKYSFQRIEVPPLPIHFCDCEEHREASETAVNKYLSSVNSGVHYEREISIMNSVMKMLFEKERNEPTSEKERILATAEKVSHPTAGDIHKEESEQESEMDADNLVTNIGVGIRDSRKMQLGGQTLAVNQVFIFPVFENSKFRSIGWSHTLGSFS